MRRGSPLPGGAGQDSGSGVVLRRGPQGFAEARLDLIFEGWEEADHASESGQLGDGAA